MVKSKSHTALVIFLCSQLLAHRHIRVFIVLWNLWENLRIIKQFLSSSDGVIFCPTGLISPTCSWGSLCLCLFTQKTSLRSGLQRSNTSAPMFPSSSWEIKRTCVTMSTPGGNLPKWSRWLFQNEQKQSVRDDCVFPRMFFRPFCQEPVKPEEGRDMANRISAFGYMECSAKTKDGVREVFEMATRAALQARRGKKSSKCVLL